MSRLFIWCFVSVCCGGGELWKGWSAWPWITSVHYSKERDRKHHLRNNSQTPKSQFPQQTPFGRQETDQFLSKCVRIHRHLSSSAHGMAVTSLMIFSQYFCTIDRLKINREEITFSLSYFLWWVIYWTFNGGRYNMRQFPTPVHQMASCLYMFDTQGIFLLCQ